MPDLTYRNSGKLLIWFEKSSFINLFMFRGSDRTNLTTLIEQNGTALHGAPYLVSIDDGVVLVA